MENILKIMGRFVGEKFALLETIYQKKGEVPSSLSSTNVINGYVEMLPPRPVKEDRYIIANQPQGTLYEGIYHLNFGRNRKNGKFFIIGDNQVKATGTKCWVVINATNEVYTSLIPVHPGANLKIYTGTRKFKSRTGLTHTIEEYDTSGILIKSSVFNVLGPTPTNYTTASNTQTIKLKITGEGEILYIKVWEHTNKIIDHSKIYCWNGKEWVTEKVPENTLITVKGKSFALIHQSHRFNKVSLVTIPKLSLIEGKVTMNQSIKLKSPIINDNYIFKIFVKRKRLCKRVTNGWGYKNKYFEILKPRSKGLISSEEWKQPSFSPSRVPITGDSFDALPYTWNSLLGNIFVFYSMMTNGAKFSQGKLYPRTGLYCRNKHLTRTKFEFADFAICLSKKIGGKWVDGEKTYFRLRQCKLNSALEFTLKIL